MRRIILPALLSVIAASSIAYGQDYLSALFRGAHTHPASSKPWPATTRLAQLQPQDVEIPWQRARPVRHRVVALHRSHHVVVSHAALHQRRAVWVRAVALPRPRPVVLAATNLVIVRNAPGMAITVPAVDPFGTPVQQVYRSRSPYDPLTYRSISDPLANLFMSSASSYIPPQAVCQNSDPSSPVCNYQRPYLVFDQIHGGAFDISPDYMKNIDPRYNAALLNAGG